MQTTLGINGTGLGVRFESPGISGEEERLDLQDGKFVRKVGGGTFEVIYDSLFQISQEFEDKVV